MNRLLLLLPSLLIVCCGFSQSRIENYEIGNYMDWDHQLIDGYFDTNYSPENSFSLSYKFGEDYSNGYYYDINNKKIEGLIKNSQSNTFFKFSIIGSKIETTIKPDSCNGYCIGLDTFAVIKNFNVERFLGGFKSDKREFAEVIEIVDNITFYKHTRSNFASLVTTYLYNMDGSEDYISFPKEYTEFKETAIKIFGEFESLKNQIQKGKFHESDVPSLIKMFKYKRMFDKNQLIYFSSSWEEVDSTKENAYYAKIVSIEDSMFTLKYFLKDGTPIYEGNFTSFYPHKPAGEFKWFYPNGTIRKTTVFKKEKPELTKTYFRSGQVHYELNEKKDNPYMKVFNHKGFNIMDENGNGIEIYYDSINQKDITYQFKDHKIISVFYVDSGNRRVYQMTQFNAKIKNLWEVKSIFSETNTYPQQSLSKYNYGIVLVKCLIEPSGEVTDIKLIKSVDNECDKLALDLMENLIAKKYFKPGKYYNIAVAQEIIVPFSFSISGFSWYRSNNYNYNFWHFNQMQMDQQQMIKKINLPKTPPPPRFR